MYLLRSRDLKSNLQSGHANAYLVLRYMSMQFEQNGVVQLLHSIALKRTLLQSLQMQFYLTGYCSEVLGSRVTVGSFIKSLAYCFSRSRMFLSGLNFFFVRGGLFSVI